MAVIQEEPENYHQAQESDSGSGEKARESDHHEEEKPDFEEKESDHHDDDDPETEKGERPAENLHEGGDHVSQNRITGTTGSDTSSRSGPNQDIPPPNELEESIERSTEEQRSDSKSNHCCDDDANANGDVVNGYANNVNSGNEENGGNNGEYENGENGGDQNSGDENNGGFQNCENDGGDEDEQEEDEGGDEAEIGEKNLPSNHEILQRMVDYNAARGEYPIHNHTIFLDFVRNWLHIAGDADAMRVELRVSHLVRDYGTGNVTDPDLLRMCRLIWGVVYNSVVAFIEEITDSGPRSGSGSEENGDAYEVSSPT